MVQGMVLALLMSIPLFGVFRIDFASARFVILGHSLGWDNYRFLAGMVLVVLSVPLLTYVTIGPVWCGWACPQSFLTEMANALTTRFLGKRADVRVDGAGMIVAPTKNRLTRWLALAGLLLIPSFLLGVLVLMGFYSSAEVWGFLLGTAKRQTNMAVMLGFSVSLFFIDIAVIRYFLCDYACFYRMGQRLFQTKEVLHIGYDTDRAAACVKCHCCATVCPTRIEPNRIKLHDICIDCGECIDACDRLHQRGGDQGLLHFARGHGEKERRAAKPWWKRHFFAGSMGAVLLLGCALMAWGVATQPTINFRQIEARQQRLLQITRVCQPRCAPLQTACRGDNLKRCYEAAACTCACSLEMDPSNPQHAIWQSCVRINREHERALGTASSQAAGGGRL